MIVIGDDDKNINKQYNNIKVLMYHKIIDEGKSTSSQWISVGREEFRKHLMLLDKWGFTPITFRDYLLFMKGQIPLPKKPVILTFDDGYEEVYKIAFPMLKDLGWNAVVFVIGDPKIKIDLWNNKLLTGNPSLLNSDQIIEMHEAGLEIGSHSMSHLYLPNEPYTNAWYEISWSKDELELLIGSSIQSFSYPYGAVNNHLKQMVKIAGYKIGCGVYTGPPKFGQDILDIRRITIPGGTSTVNFAFKMLTPYEYYEYAGSKVLHRKNGNSNANEFEHSRKKQKQTELI
ncbi:MAG: polysaccharide deacetylase family protein [Melioribacter sp.]|nr:polysaccharide deacetylase family protein [Melioribacter sp.]